ncbi:MAG: MFS transporter [Mycobacteriales bacterium]
MSPFTPGADGRPHPRRTLLVLSLPALSFSLAQTMLIPAFGDLVRDLHSDVATVTWLLTGYFVAAAVCTPLVGRLGDMFGKRRLLLLSLVAFAVGNVVSALGHDVRVVVAGRVVQGVAGGLFPLCFGIIRDEFPPSQVGSSIGAISAMIGLGGGAGLLIGGILIDAFGYSSIFWLGAACSVLSLVMIALLVPESPLRTPGRVDLRGAFVLGVALVAVLVAVSKGNAWGWASLRTLGLIAAGLGVFALWVPLQARTANPLVDIRTLARPAVLLTNTATLLVGFGLFGAFALVPQLVEAPSSGGFGFGASATRAGLIMVPGSIAMLVIGPLSGALGARYGHRFSLGLGSVLAAVGLAMLAAYHGSNTAVVGWFFVLSVGIGFAFAAMPNLILSTVPAYQSGEATGFNAVVRAVGSSLGTQVSAVVVVSSATVGSLVPRESGYTDAFLLCAVVAAAAAVVSFLIPAVRRREQPAGVPAVVSASRS